MTLSVDAHQRTITRPTFPRVGRPPIGVPNHHLCAAEQPWSANQPRADAEHGVQPDKAQSLKGRNSASRRTCFTLDHTTGLGYQLLSAPLPDTHRGYRLCHRAVTRI